MKIKIAFFVLVTLFLAWSAFQPNGFLTTVKNNLWSLELVDRLFSDPGQTSQIAIPAPQPHSAVLLARQAIKDGEFQTAQNFLNPLLTFQDRAVQGTYAELLYASEKKSQAFSIWQNLNETIILERAANQSSQLGDDPSLLAANQALYRLDPEKYTSSLAFTLKLQGQLSEAEDLLLLSRSDYPQSKYGSDWLRYLADVYSGEGDWLKAEDVYWQVIQENPDDLRAWRNLGLLYNSQLNKPDKAIECFQKMISISPGETYGYSLLAQTYEKIGDISRALLTYQNLLLVSPDDPAVLQEVERLTKMENLNP